MNEGKKVRVKVRTIHSTYTGNLFIPAERKRFSDVINEPDTIFINPANDNFYLCSGRSAW